MYGQQMFISEANVYGLIFSQQMPHVNATNLDPISTFDGVCCLRSHIIDENTLLLKEGMPLLGTNPFRSVAQVFAQTRMRAVDFDPHVIVVAGVNSFFKDWGHEKSSAAHGRRPSIVFCRLQ
jgi:hypothetical protein